MSEPTEATELTRAQTPEDPDLEQIVEKVSTEHGFDVRGYKRTTLYRRVRKRMADAGCSTVEEYLLRLETDQREYVQLVDTILINVTEFFRDPDAWEYLKNECLAPHVQRSPGYQLRIWSAGCASGEEPYSLAICLAELLGERALREMKLYATDVDDAALAQARTGVYQADNLRNVSPERLERFFEELPGGRYSVRRELRSCIIFGRHNILVDPPISRLDILTCRNLLIYFDAETQRQILNRFHYALRDHSHLFLGKAETMMTHSLLFRPAEARFRIFQRVPQQGVGRTLMNALEPRRGAADPADLQEADQALAVQNYLLHAIVDRAREPVVLLDAGLRIQIASGAARELFGISDRLIGRSFSELDERARPMSLRVVMEDVRTTGRGALLNELELVRGNGSIAVLSVDVQPIQDPRGVLTQILIWGRDTTLERTLNLELAQARQELETVSEELQTTNEELETTNEELQSTNEELETTNEELQSTNEELETTVEELQSTNEELESANEELRTHQQELHELARYQDMILSGLRMGLIVMDRRFVVTGWNRVSQETWGLREEEVVGQELFDLDFGLPLDGLRAGLFQALEGKEPEPVAVEATNRRGRSIHCRARVSPMLDGSNTVPGAMLVVSDIQERA